MKSIFRRLWIRVSQPFRFALVLINMFVYLGVMSVIWIFIRGRWNRVRWSHWILTFFCQMGLKFLNVRVRVLAEPGCDVQQTGLYVSNHLSYVDVLVIHGHFPACFVTSKEVQRTPVLGQVCTLAGCLFVDRKNKANLLGEIAQITEGLQEGLSVAIFPEATSTNGEQILRFRRPLFMAAIAAGKPVLPLCLNYRVVGTTPIHRGTRDQVFWYGDMNFVTHLWALTGSGGVEVDLHRLAPVWPVQGEEPGPLSERSQMVVESKFQPVT